MARLGQLTAAKLTHVIPVSAHGRGAVVRVRWGAPRTMLGQFSPVEKAAVGYLRQQAAIVAGRTPQQQLASLRGFTRAAWQGHAATGN